MALNLGAFAGGLAQGGLNTYKMLSDIEDRKKETAIREAAERRAAIEFEQRQRDVETQRTAAAESYGRIGQAALSGDLRADTGIGQQQATALGANSGDAGFDAADRAQLADTLRANAAQAPQTAQTAAMNPARPTMTREMAADEYAKRLYAAGMTEKAQQAEATGLQISAGKRSERYAHRQENALGFGQNVMDDLQKNGGNIGEVIDKHFIPLYNENKLPGLNDGGTAKVVPNAVGGGSTIVITGKDGKESTMPADIKTLQMLTSKAQDLMMASATPENYWKHKEQHIKERQVAAAETSAGAAVTSAATHAKELDEKIKAGLFGAQANLAKAQAGQAGAHAALYNNMVRLGNESRAVQEAMKPALEAFAKLTPEEQQGARGQQILTDAAVAAARKTGDVTSVINALKKPDRSVVSAERERGAYAALNKALESGDQKLVEQAKAQYPDVFGEDPLVKAFREKQGAGAAATGKKSTALPVRAVDQDELARPGAPTALPTGAYTFDARPLLRTPKTGSGMQAFTPND